MAVTVSTVPDSVPFARVQELVRSLGFETHDLVSLSLSRDAVTAVVLAKNADGKRYLVDKEPAQHTVTIPVTPAPNRFEHRNHVHAAVYPTP
jgi:hypothetical protein